MFKIWHCKTPIFFPQISMGFLDICHPQKQPLVIALQGFYTGTESHSGCTDDTERKPSYGNLKPPFSAVANRELQPHVISNHPDFRSWKDLRTSK